MTHSPAPARRRPARRGVPRISQMITAVGGLASFAAITIGLAPVASAAHVPLPPPTPATTAPAHFPLWAILTMIAATILLSVATTLITLYLARLRRAHRAAAPEPVPASTAITAATPEPKAAQDDILTSHPYAVTQDTHQSGSY